MARSIPRPHFIQQKYFWLGIVGALVIALLLAISPVYKAIGPGKKTFDAEFTQAAGLKSSDKVRIAGIEVGQVKSEKIENGHVVATLQVNNDVKLGADAKATIKTSTILGGNYVALTPGDGKGLPGNRIPLSNTQVPFDLAKVVQDPKYPSQWDRVQNIDTKQIADAITVLGRQLGDSPQLTSQALDSVGAIAKVIDSRRDQVEGLLKNLDKVSGILDDNRNNILMIMGDVGAIGARVMERQQLVQNLLANVGTLSRQLTDIAGANKGQLGPMIQKLNTISQGLEKNRDQLNRLLQIAPVTVRQVSTAWGGEGDYADVYLPWGLFPDRLLCGVPGLIEGCK